MATLPARQPFAPLNSSRLQNLTNLKNRQNAIITPQHTLTSPTKRKASSYEDEDAENVDPVIFITPKRAKGGDGARNSNKDTLKKPSVAQFFLKPASTTPLNLTAARPILQARSPAPKINTKPTITTPLSAPAGRSPTRKRIGILNRRRTTSSFSRVDPPKFAAQSTGLNFSIDAALSGTIPSFAARQRAEAAAAAAATVVPETLREPDTKDSWFFEIHEDTEEELATNLMEHSTCTLDLSSDDETEARLKDQRGKENVPPLDDISQTRAMYLSSSAPTKARRQKHEAAIEIDRSPLGEMLAEDFYAEGCDKESVIVIPAEVEESAQEEEAPSKVETTTPAPAPVLELKSVEELMTRTEPQQVKLLQPIVKSEAEFQVWESGSDKGEE